VVREFLNPDVSRSGLDRCLRRHGGHRYALDRNPVPNYLGPTGQFSALKNCAAEPGWPGFAAQSTQIRAL
jgi:hypothetical protein